MINKKITKGLKLELSISKKFIMVSDAKTNEHLGFIWNNDNEIMMNGYKVKSSDFFKA